MRLDPMVCVWVCILQTTDGKRFDPCLHCVRHSVLAWR